MTSPSCNCLMMDSCSGQRRNPASLLPFFLCTRKQGGGPTDYQVIPSPACNTPHPGRFWVGGHPSKASAQAGSRRTGTTERAPAIPAGMAASPVENPSSSQAPPERALGAPHPEQPPVPQQPWFSRQPRCLLATGQCQEQFPADSWIFFFFSWI